MAIKNDIVNSITDINVSWEGKTGAEVEDFISKRLAKPIGSMTYTNTTLTLFNPEGDVITSTPITVAEANYDYSIVFYGLKVNGVVHTGQNLLMQCKDDTVVEAGIAIRSVAQVLDNVSDNNGRFKVSFEFNGSKCDGYARNISKDYFTLSGNDYILHQPEGVDLESVIAWVDISSIFKKRSTGDKVTVSFIPPGKERLQATLETTITNEVIRLLYNGDVVIDQTSVKVQFENDTDFSKYDLVGFKNNETKTFTVKNSGQIEGLQPGLNQIVVRAEHNEDKSICTDWLNFDVICTADFEGTAIAVNGVSSGITNNGVATLYKMCIYSSLREEVELTTYLEDEIPDSVDPEPTQVIKSEFVSASSYNRDTNTTNELSYKKYIEVESSDSTKYLLIKCNGEFYQFKTPTYSPYNGTYNCINAPFIKMDIEKCNSDYVYIKKYNISKNYDQITGQINNLFSTDLQSKDATLISDLESSDGWKERDGITYLKLSKQGKDVLKSGIDLSLNDNFTIEMGFRTYNVSDKAQSILNIGKLTLFPTQLGWDYNEGITSTNFLKRNAQFQEDYDTHITVTVTKGWTTSKDDPYYPDFLGSTAQPTFDAKAPNTTINLMRIYINGCIDREVVLEDTELQELKKSLLQINPKSADIDLYLFRVYNSQPLSHREVIQNYISFLPLKTGDLSKESIFNKNDILDDTGKISWSKCQGKVNTLLFIYHDGGRFPHRFWGQEDNQSDNDANKEIPCTLIVNYADPIKNAKYGGVLDKLQCKGQGSSAMRYLIWNVNSSLNKFKYKENGEEKKAKSTFKPFGQLWVEQERPDLMPSGTSDTYSEIKGYYPMPTYDGEKDTKEYKYTKMVGKVNFASSMQSHKIGACKLYDDAYKSSLGTDSLPSGGKKAVHEEPYMYFFIETPTLFNSDYTSELDCKSISYDKILELGEQAKFMGFQTWGPGKGDDACSGYDDDATPHYLMLEGGENTDPSVNFQRPWQALQRLRLDFVRDGQVYKYGVGNTDLMEYPTVNKEESLADPSAQLLIDDESIVYMNRGAWDIDYGFEEEEVGDMVYYNIPENGSRQSLFKFREFYDNVYKWDFTCVWVKSGITEPQSDWSQNKKYCVVASRFNIGGMPVSGHKSGDVYRFDEPSNSWVPAGVYYNDGWERLNFVEEIARETGETGINASMESTIKEYLQNIFKDKMQKFLKIDDIAFHQAFIKFLSGTDNRAKNTYFQIIGPMYHEVDKIGEDGQPVVNEDGETETEFVLSGEGDSLIRLIGDDLDTILVTDNNGLQSKPYNLLEDSYDETFYDHWGDVGNIFFRMFDQSYEGEIKAQLAKIMDTAALKPSSVNDKSSYFYKQFFKVQEDFPEIAYNNAATIYYENAQIIKNSTGGQSIYGFTYTNNDVQPIEQSHGSCLQGEKQFMKERIAFLAGYAGTVTSLDNDLSTASSAGGGKALKMKLDFIPVQDFYPTYQYEKGVVKPIGEYVDSKFDILKYKATAGQPYEQIIDESKSAINQNLFQVNLYKQLTITGLQVNDLNGNLASTTDLTVDNDIITNDSTGLFGDDYPTLNLSKFSANLPVVERLTLRNLPLPSELNLADYNKLQVLDLTGSNVENVVFPQTGLLTDLILPASIKTFEIYNNPNLSNVTFESTENLETIYIDSTKCKSFNVAQFCEDLNALSLSSVSIKNLRNVYLTEEALYKLLVNYCDLSGEITIVETAGSTTPKQISFKTKQDLVNLFGDIVSGSNGLKINFTEEQILSFTCNSEVNAFYDSKKGGSQTFANLYNIQVASGNDASIVNDQNPFNPSVIGYLDISYRLKQSVSNVSVDSKTGTITVKGKPGSGAEVIITLKTNQGYSLTQNVRIVFQWSAPKIGDFAYIDGTFSSYYNSSKTLVGLVYSKDGDDNSGTVYIIGKEYANTAHYSGYTTQGGSSGAGEGTTSNFIYQTDEFKKSLAIGTPYQPDGVSTASNNLISDIQYDKSSDINKLPMTGKTDTMYYVNLVNSTLLPPLRVYDRNRYQRFIDFSGSNYSIANIDQLNLLCEEMELDNVGSKFDAGLIYPYFYSAYLYQPACKDGENIDTQYTQGNWYMPSVGELSRIIYYRGYSSGGSSFLSRACRQAIKEDVVSGNTDYTTPIFSLALKAMGQYNFPAVWNNIVGSGNSGTSNNITTTVSGYDSAADNYSYQVYESYTGSGTTYSSQWMKGEYNEYSYQGQGPMNGWRYTKHQGIPFVQYNYTNPSN